jgi:hypothetical protein
VEGEIVAKDLLIEFQQNVECVNIYSNGNEFVYDDKSNEFENVLSNISNLFEGSREMPAFGVSLDKETKNAMKKGVWVEIIYKTKTKHREMDFDSLLFEVNGEYTGINVIRGNDSVYEGRCFYFDLNKNMTSFLNYINNLIKK